MGAGVAAAIASARRLHGAGGRRAAILFASGTWLDREVHDGGTPAAMQRKGARQVVQERLVRPGVPLLVFGFLLGPLAVALDESPATGQVGVLWRMLLSDGTFVIGPLGFAWAFMLVAIEFAAWRHARPKPMRHACRLVPVGENVLGLQLVYFASYVLLFALGCTASRHRWLKKVECRQAVPWAWVTMFTLPLLFVVAAPSGALEGKPGSFNGGIELPEVVSALWEPFVA